jgi:hypothetical protein
VFFFGLGWIVDFLDLFRLVNWIVQLARLDSFHSWWGKYVFGSRIDYRTVAAVNGPLVVLGISTIYVDPI